MTKIARKILNANNHDNMVIDRLINESGYQEHFPAKIDRSKQDKTVYMFDDHSALIHKHNNNEWISASTYK